MIGRNPSTFFIMFCISVSTLVPNTNRPGIIIDLLSNVWVGPLVQRILYITAFIRITLIVKSVDALSQVNSDSPLSSFKL